MRRRIVAIVNPVSGRRDVTPIVQDIVRRIEHIGARIDVRRTARAGHATQLAADLEEGVEAVLAVGGDGTLSEIAAGLTTRSIPLLALASGTENLLARELAMPRDPAGIAQTLLHGVARPYDMGVINGRPFLVVAGAGFDAECVHRMSESRQGHISRLSYVGPVGRALLAHRSPHLRVEVDGEVVFDAGGLVVFGIATKYGGGLRPLLRARIDDGLLDVCAMACSTRTGLLIHAGRILLRRHLAARGVVYRQGRCLRITSPDRAAVQVDGDAAGFLPVDCTIVPGAMRFLRSAAS